MSSRDIFELRRNGDLIAGYNLGKKLLEVDPSDAWVLKAFAYCALDLARKSAINIDYALAESFFQEIKDLENRSFFIDEMLQKYINSTALMINPENKILSDAKFASRNGEREKALNLYRAAVKKMPKNIDANNSLGWELYHQIKKITDVEKIDVKEVRGLLVEYMHLIADRPSVLHSSIIRLALKIADQDDFNGFVKAWDLSNFRSEDFDQYVKDGKTYPSLAEKVIQKAAKKADDMSVNIDASNYILPFLDLVIDKYPDNQWLVYYKAKLLHKIGHKDEALNFALNFVKKKMSDFWSWGLLASVVSSQGDLDLTLSCYCKSLLCRADDEFLVKTRINIAQILIEKGLFEQAKFEISTVISTYESNKWKIKDEILDYTYCEWYKNAICPQSNFDFYEKNIDQADNLLFSTEPWLKANLGEKFKTDQNPPKTRRKLYVSVQNQKAPLELSVPEKKYDFSKMKVGDGLLVKGELDVRNKFNVYILKSRSFDFLWDVFNESIGVIDHVNYNKGVFHFIVSKDLDGVLGFDNKEGFLEGSFISVKMYHFYRKDGTLGYGSICFSKTDQQPSTNIFRHFNDFVVNCSAGLAFTNDGVFIDRNLVRENDIDEGSYVDGFAVLNFNQKKSVWGWKALKITSISKQDDDLNL